MPEPIEGWRAVAEAIALSRPQVVCAHPVAPPARIVEILLEMARAGALAHCEFVNVESGSAALSAAIGAAAGGTRAYVASGGPGLLCMAEAVHDAAGLQLPLVMTIGNRSGGAPPAVRDDHSDSMSMRDAGWIQLYAETSQEALDLHLVAFRLAEALSCPVMVCLDGAIPAPARGRVDVPTQEQVDAFLPPFEPRRELGNACPSSIGAMAGPEAFMEVRYLAHHKQLRALQLIPQLSAAFRQQFGRDPGGLIRAYRSEDAETIVVALGSVNGTVRQVVDEMRAAGIAIGSVGICSFRPFPLAALRAALQHAKRVVVLEKCFATGLGGIVSDGARNALSGIRLKGYTVIAGLGGRAITRASLRQLFEDAGADELEPLTFLDLDAARVSTELERETQVRRAGPAAKALQHRAGAGGSRMR